MTATYFDIRETPCKAFLPASGPVRLAIVAVHGFAGGKEGPEIEALARRMCPEGAAVYCFDFPAHGARPRGGEALALRACSDALLSVAAYVADRHRVPKGVFATGFGGYVTLLCMDELEAALGGFALALVAPAVKMAGAFESRTPGDERAKAAEGGSAESGLERKAGASSAFLGEPRGGDACRPFAKPMLVVHGADDDVVTPADIDEFMALNPLAKLVRVQGAGHGFGGEGEIEAVVDAARDYFGLPIKIEAVNDFAPIAVTPEVEMHNERAKIHGIYGLFLKLNKPNLCRFVSSDDGYCVTDADQVVEFLRGGYYKLAFDAEGPYWLHEPCIADYFWGDLGTELIRLTGEQAAALELDRVTRHEFKDAVSYTRRNGEPATRR